VSDSTSASAAGKHFVIMVGSSIAGLLAASKHLYPHDVGLGISGASKFGLSKGIGPVNSA
jgi:hypothetical protein